MAIACTLRQPSLGGQVELPPEMGRGFHLHFPVLPVGRGGKGLRGSPQTRGRTGRGLRKEGRRLLGHPRWTWRRERAPLPRKQQGAAWEMPGRGCELSQPLGGGAVMETPKALA